MNTKLQEMENEFEQMNSDYNEKIAMLNKLQVLKPETEFAISRLKLDIQSLVSEKKEVTQICKNLIAEQQNWKRTTLLNNSYFQRKKSWKN